MRVEPEEVVEVAGNLIGRQVEPLYGKTGFGRNGQQVSLQICSERDDDADDGLRITVLRVPGHTTSAMPTVYAPLEGGQGA